MKRKFQDLVGKRRLREILDGAARLSGLVVQVSDDTGCIFGRSGFEGRCRLDLEAPELTSIAGEVVKLHFA